MFPKSITYFERMNLLDTYGYTREFLILRNIVNSINPMNLNGCPDDEYDHEVQAIMELIPEAKSVEELAELIQEVFRECFSKENVGEFKKYTKMAERILDKETWL